ncbi:MAG: hypothetical protein JO257_29015 [Deltaproteobacteria bacterium]|nr:hypothetical protein [Deltaproteobacteria bacterium]
MRASALVLLAACGAGTVKPSAPAPLPAEHQVVLDTTPKERRRMLPPEVYLRAYLGWFGGLAPLDVQNRARPKGLFDAWEDYLSALGLPDYKIDLPRQTQSNTLMLATLGRLGEVLCVRAAEHDLHVKTPLDQRVVFAFDPKAGSLDEFSVGFDVLHRTFLGYPVRLAPADRAQKFYALFDEVRARHKAKNPLSPDETAWAAVCAALVQHPEAELY